VATETPIKDSVGSALRFTRGHWRLVLALAAASAVLQVLALMLLGSAPPIAFFALLFIATGAHALMVRTALDGADAARATPVRDTMRALGAVAIIGAFLFIIALVVAYVAMSVLIAPFMEEAKAAGENQAALQAVMEQAVAAQPHVLTWATIIGALIVFVFTSRFYLAVPLSIDQGRILVFESWRRTRGQLLRIVAARLWLLFPALVLVFALQSLIGRAVGINAADFMVLAAQAQSNPWGFLIFFTAGQFVQVAIYASLEAGLAAGLYRALPQPAPPRAR